jgi:hypothetical protein
MPEEEEKVPVGGSGVGGAGGIDQKRGVLKKISEESDENKYPKKEENKNVMAQIQP